MNAIRSLVRDHSLLNLLWTSLEKLTEQAVHSGRMDWMRAGEALDVINNYAMELHIRKEEEHLLPAMVEAGVPEDFLPIQLLKDEHLRIGADIGVLSSLFLDAKKGGEAGVRDIDARVRKTADFVRLHIFREEYNVYPVGEIVLSKEQHEALDRQFQEYDAAYGRDKLAHFEATILRIAQECGLGLCEGKVTPLVAQGLGQGREFNIETFASGTP